MRHLSLVERRRHDDRLALAKAEQAIERDALLRSCPDLLITDDGRSRIRRGAAIICEACECGVLIPLRPLVQRADDDPLVLIPGMSYWHQCALGCPGDVAAIWQPSAIPTSDATVSPAIGDGQ